MTDEDRSNQNEAAETQGKVYLVGAGPGDPGLLTLRGMECLQDAEVVLYDGLANSKILSHAAQAEWVSVGKHGQTPIWTQDRINERLLELARAGKRVVRLKGGDPAVFARTAEELEVLAASGIPFEVVPGITAALAAASYVGIPITHRDHASAVAFITGQQQAGGTPQQIDWNALANFPGTLVFYMGVTTVRDWSTKLMEAGKSPETPAAIIRRCTWGDQQIFRTQLHELSERLTPASKLRPPVIVVLGDVAKLGEDFDWFTSRPLFGCGVLVSQVRSVYEVSSFAGGNRDSQSELSARLNRMGADVYEQTALEAVAAADTTSLDAAIDQIVGREDPVEGITFASRNGVNAFFERLEKLGYDARSLAGLTLACVGPATARALQAYGVRADVVPEAADSFNATGLVAAIATSSQQREPASKWVVVKTNKSSGQLESGLERLGADVLPALAYETKRCEELEYAVKMALAKSAIRYCIITSPEVGRAMIDLLGAHTESIAPIAMSEGIAGTLSSLGWIPAAVAESNTPEAICEALQRVQA
ncbi:MAG: uroporphyrinogen-III C-methyltransferase [Aureliella sp.]